jgi:hypothetical protein
VRERRSSGVNLEPAEVVMAARGVANSPSFWRDLVLGKGMATGLRMGDLRRRR